MTVIDVNWQFWTADELWEELKMRLNSIFDLKKIKWGKTYFEDKTEKVMVVEFHTEEHTSFLGIPIGCYPFSGTVRVYFHHDKKYFVTKIELIDILDYRPEKIMLN